MRREPHNHHLRLRIDVNALPVNAPRRERPVAVVRNPPHVAITPPRQRLVTGHREFRFIAAATDVFHHRSRNNLLPVESAAQPDHLSEPGQIPQCQIQSSAGRLRPNRIHSEIPVLLHPQPAPQPFPQNFGDRFPRHSGHHPRQRLGVYRLIVELLPVRILLRQSLQIPINRVRAREPRRHRRIPRRAAVIQKWGPRVVVMLGILQPRGHIQHFANRRISQPACLQLRDILRHGRLLVQHAF